MKKYYYIFFPLLFLIYPLYTHATLSCSITASSTCTGVVVLRLSGNGNAHAELPSQSTAAYDANVICCSGSGSQILGNSCAATSTTFLKLEQVTNSHVQESVQSGYTNNACISVALGSATSSYQIGGCSGYDTTIASISSTTNAHVGTSTEFSIKVCGSETDGIQRLTFNLSTSTVYMGQVSSIAIRYGSSTNSLGDGAEVEAHNFTVKTSATNGYTVTVQGDTLNLGKTPLNATNTITALGGTNTAPSVGSEQFGIRLVASGGVGTVTAPYAASGFAYAATSLSSSQVASASVGDNATTTYSVRYMANIANTTEPGSYLTNIVYVVTANF